MLKISAVAMATGAAVMQMPSAEAQTVAVPVSGGGFVVRYDTTLSTTSMAVFLSMMVEMPHLLTAQHFCKRSLK